MKVLLTLTDVEPAVRLNAMLEKEGTGFEIEIRGKRIGAQVVKMPFYKEGSHL